jgi:hypothetical protein
VSVDKARRVDWIVGGLALLLVIDLLELPWYTVGGGTISGISLPSISNPATGPPAAFLGVLAMLASLAVVLDLVFEYLSPATTIFSLGGNRSFTRYVLAIAAVVLLALKFILHLGEIRNLGVGFWFGAILAAALVYATKRARRDEPAPRASAVEPGDANGAESQQGSEASKHSAPADDSQFTEARESESAETRESESAGARETSGSES